MDPTQQYSQTPSDHHAHLWSHTPHVQPQQPAPYPASEPVRPHAGSAREIVWQWVCYVLWGWTLFALGVFLSATLSYFLVKDSVGGEFSAYAFAAVLVLLPIAFFVDRAYRAYEPAEKHGFAAVVLVLNALFVFLTIVGGVLAAAMSVFWLIVNAEMSPAAATSIISSLVITFLGCMLFARIVRFDRIERFVRLFPLAVLTVAVITTILAMAGPVRSLVTSRNDRLIEDNLYTLDTAIQDYASDNRRLPGSLSDLNLKQASHEGAKKLVDKKLVTYAQDTEAGSTSSMRYELCATFSKEKGNGSTSDNDVYSVRANHGKGKQCYSLTVYGGPDTDTDASADDSTLDDYYDSPEYKRLLESLEQTN